MRSFSALLLLPTTLLHLVTAQVLQHWPHDLPRTLKYYPEHEDQLRRHADIRARLETEVPSGVRKMSSDEGEKFHLEYWDFGDEDIRLHDGDWTVNRKARLYGLTGAGYTNTSSVDTTTYPRSAIRQHSWKHHHDRSFLDKLSRSLFARAFQCPAGTHSCASIDHPNLCCSSDATCVSTSSGVGCCPAGETCGQNGVAGCDTDAGYTSCPASPNGGCCVPGAKCDGAGCVFVGTRTVTTTLPTSTATMEGGSGSSSAALSTSSRITPPPVASVYTTTVTVTNSPGSFTTTRTIVVSTPSSSGRCSAGFSTCPAASGGGCCRTGQVCGTDDRCIDASTSTVTPSAPIRPTSISASTSTSTTTTPSPGTACPNGYYMCSAYYLGDCCRVGRDCDTTSCPPMPSTTVVSGGVTVVVSGTGALSATSAVEGGTCAQGWALCPAAVGGGCCPTDYLCGISSCRATASAEGDTGKMAPNSGAGVVRWAWGFGAVALGAASLMVWL